jgi:hypothetical protein
MPTESALASPKSLPNKNGKKLTRHHRVSSPYALLYCLSCTSFQYILTILEIFTISIRVFLYHNNPEWAPNNSIFTYFVSRIKIYDYYRVNWAINTR